MLLTAKKFSVISGFSSFVCEAEIHDCSEDEFRKNATAVHNLPYSNRQLIMMLSIYRHVSRRGSSLRMCAFSDLRDQRWLQPDGRMEGMGSGENMESSNANLEVDEKPDQIKCIGCKVCISVSGFTSLR